mmetsp:Transcript_14470/g.37102  ORF Transcript_14470/g.37102 Transcript_14470/m.37102 type:complete len:332 (-) Transcript_14470:598-1593(-)
MFSPSLAMVSFSTCPTVLSSSLSQVWFMRAISSNCFFRRPSTIFSLMLSGLPARSSFAISSSLAFAFCSAGTSSEEMATTVSLAASCMARSAVNSLKIALLATKSVSLFTSTSTASFELKCTYEAMLPSTAMLPAFLSALATPFFLSHAMAASMSPSHSARAFLQSRMPARERSRSAFTAAAPVSPALACGSAGFSSAAGSGAASGSGVASATGSSAGFSGSGAGASSAAGSSAGASSAGGSSAASSAGASATGSGAGGSSTGSSTGGSPPAGGSAGSGSGAGGGAPPGGVQFLKAPCGPLTPIRLFHSARCASRLSSCTAAYASRAKSGT